MAKRKKNVIKKTIQAVLLGSAIVMFWRGSWGLMDMYFFPHSQAFGYVISLVISVVILVIAHHLSDIA